MEETLTGGSAAHKREVPMVLGTGYLFNVFCGGKDFVREWMTSVQAVRHLIGSSTRFHLTLLYSLYRLKRDAQQFLVPMEKGVVGRCFRKQARRRQRDGRIGSFHQLLCFLRAETNGDPQIAAVLCPSW